jgi:ankyrin repeat protein
MARTKNKRIKRSRNRMSRKLSRNRSHKKRKSEKKYSKRKSKKKYSKRRSYKGGSFRGMRRSLGSLVGRGSLDQAAPVVWAELEPEEETGVEGALMFGPGGDGVAVSPPVLSAAGEAALRRSGAGAVQGTVAPPVVVDAGGAGSGASAQAAVPDAPANQSVAAPAVDPPDGCLDDECPICGESLTDPPPADQTNVGHDKQYYAAPCRHCFHFTCLATWVEGYGTLCPNCREEIPLEDFRRQRQSAAARMQLAGVVGVEIEGMPDAEFNSVYRRVVEPEHEDKFPFKSEGGKHLFQGPGGRWYLLDEFDPPDVRPAAYVESPSGLLPVGGEEWTVEGSNLTLTVLLLKTEAEIRDAVGRRMEAVMAEAAAQAHRMRDAVDLVGENDDSKLTFIVHIYLPDRPRRYGGKYPFRLEIIIDIDGAQTIQTLKKSISQRVTRWVELGKGCDGYQGLYRVDRTDPDIVSDYGLHFSSVGLRRKNARGMWEPTPPDHIWNNFQSVFPPPEKQKMVRVGNISGDEGIRYVSTIEDRRSLIFKKAEHLMGVTEGAPGSRRRGFCWVPLISADESDKWPVLLRAAAALPANRYVGPEVDRMTITEAGLENGDILLLTELEDMCGPLASACCNGTLSVVQEMLSQGADPNTTARILWATSRFGDPDERLTLEALPREHSERKELALQAKLDPGRRDARGYVFLTPVLFCAAANGHINIVKALLEAEGIDVDSRTSNGLTPLTIATYHNYPEIVELLLKKGANVEGLIGEDEFALGWLTPLMIAVGQCLLLIVNILVEHNANINAGEPDKTAIIFAVRSYMNEDFLNSQLSPTWWPQSDLHWGKGKTRTPVTRHFNAISIVNILINKGADIDIQSKYLMRATPLGFALEHGYYPLVAALRGDHYWPFPNLSGEWEIWTEEEDPDTGEKEMVASFELKRDLTPEFNIYGRVPDHERDTGMIARAAFVAQRGQSGQRDVVCNYYTGEGRHYIPVTGEEAADLPFSMKNCTVTFDEDKADRGYDWGEDWGGGPWLFSFDQHFNGPPREDRVVRWEMIINKEPTLGFAVWAVSNKMDGEFDQSFYKEHADGRGWVQPKRRRQRPSRRGREKYSAVRKKMGEDDPGRQPWQSWGGDDGGSPLGPAFAPAAAPDPAPAPPLGLPGGVPRMAPVAPPGIGEPEPEPDGDPHPVFTGQGSAEEQHASHVAISMGFPKVLVDRVQSEERDLFGSGHENVEVLAELLRQIYYEEGRDGGLAA